ncbi:competence type IV pilus major pilin ComGC [Alkalibacillus sp. S2W]|uniref:competence type IV pilus major pilin ComGC n=1 Tax=Alkalibacillus sp. S2W TaxID=3386553 RepID=UPI00398CC0AA
MLKRILKNQKGITLVELLAVIVILGIIALIAVPAIANVIEDSRYDSVKSTAINVIEAGELYATTNDVDSVSLSDLEADGYIDLSGYGYGNDDEVVVSASNSTIDATIDNEGDVSVSFNNATVQDINSTDASALRNGNVSAIGSGADTSGSSN